MTAIIEVGELTRDRLARLAQAAGLPLDSYLSDLAWRERRAAILAGAREAAILDEQNPNAAAEYALWESASADGID
jgi:hypothetical protein